jgi:hypothetical protein
MYTYICIYNMCIYIKTTYLLKFHLGQIKFAKGIINFVIKYNLHDQKYKNIKYQNNN